MATRITAGELKEIIETSKSDTVLEESFIDTANTIIADQLEGKGLSAVILKKIELYLSAHLVAITEERGGIVVDHLSEATVRLADIYDTGFRSTRYGQVAISLDTTGSLVKMSTTKLRAEFRVV